MLLSCELLSSQHDGEQHVGGGKKQPAPQWITKKTEEDVSSARDAVRSRSPASHIVHHQASDSNKAQVLARVRI